MNNDFNEYLDKPLPSSDEAEQVCLGSVILNNEVMERVIKFLDPHDFYSPVNRKFYEAMVELYNDGEQPIGPITISETLKTHNVQPETYGGAARITNLAMGLPSLSEIDKYVKIVKTHSAARDAIRLCNAITRDLLAGDVDTQEVLDKAEHRILQLNNSVSVEKTGSIEGFVSVNEIVPTIREQFERYHRGETTGVPTGMKPLDDMLDGGGLQKKATYVLAGAEKTGKTSLALEWVRSITIDQGKCVPVVTLEMSKETMTKRLYSMHTGIPYYMFRPGFYDSANDNPYTRAIQGLDKFAKYPFRIADSLFTWSQIQRYCTRLVEDGHKEENPEVGAIVLDYLHLITLDTTNSPNREREVGQISRNIKMLSSDLEVPIIALSSLNRVNMAEGQEPEPYNLRDSGSLAYDAEAIMFLHNPAYKPGKPYEPREVTDMVLIMSRQRNGPSGRIPLKFIGPYMSFMTESQFAQHFAGTVKTASMPESKGSLFDREQVTEKLWEADDDEWQDS